MRGSLCHLFVEAWSIWEHLQGYGELQSHTPHGALESLCTQLLSYPSAYSLLSTVKESFALMPNDAALSEVIKQPSGRSILSGRGATGGFQDTPEWVPGSREGSWLVAEGSS